MYKLSKKQRVICEKLDEFVRKLNYNLAQKKDSKLTEDQKANLKNLQRVFKKIHRNLELRKEDSALIDLVNHAETLVDNILIS